MWIYFTNDDKFKTSTQKLVLKDERTQAVHFIGGVQILFLQDDRILQSTKLL